jgi:sucrose phosphorylase
MLGVPIWHLPVNHCTGVVHNRQIMEEIKSSIDTSPASNPLVESYAVFRENALHHLELVYGDRANEIFQRLSASTRRHQSDISRHEVDEIWTQRDTLLITYADSLQDSEHQPLAVLHDFLNQYLSDVIVSVHILPFFPYSSDDGFSVIDFRKVNPRHGGWRDISHIGEHFKLMFDLVINHVSRESLWFSDYVADISPANSYFIEMDPDTDLRSVTRPRSSPLLTEVNTPRGLKHVWATFSEDQIDLNFANPEVLLEFLDILLTYVSNGAKLIRLDAIAFLWKEVSTSCVHLEQTHHIVKLMRDVLDYAAPDCILLTETNVPHRENISYFGDGDEARMVYQFALPPLLLYTLNRGNSSYLQEWASSLGVIPQGCTYLNFTASHDGIGLRGLEGLLSKNEIEDLVDSMRRFGGFISMKSNPDGIDTPYEINISLFDALQGTRRGTDQWQIERFILSQVIMMSLQGIPAFYIHSLLATPNDLRGVELTGRLRSINRKRWNMGELEELLENPSTPQHLVFHQLTALISTRQHCTPFHPDSPQTILETNSNLFAILRTGQQDGKRLLCLFNISNAPQQVVLVKNPELTDLVKWHNVISDEPVEAILPMIKLPPYQFLWLIEAD